MTTRRRAVALGAVAVALATMTAPAAAVTAPGVPSPTPPANYTNTTACVTAGNAGSALKNGVSWAQSQLGYPSLWGLGQRGAGQRIAVIDTGVNPIGPLAGRLIGGGDYVVKNGTGLADCDAHGTVVAGIIAGAPDGTTGFAGVAPGAQVIAIRQSSGYYGVKDAKQNAPDRVAGTTESLAQAIRLAIAEHATIINISEASCRSATSPPDTGVAAIRAAVNAAIAADIVVVAAAGNVDSSTDCKTQNTPGLDPKTIPTPADVPGVLSVAAVDQSGQPAAFSLSGTWVSVAAPGVDIISTNPITGASGQINEFITQSGVSPIQGTSFAAPYVTGLVALVRDRFRDLPAAAVVRRIERTAEHPAAPGGRNDFVGFGVINPAAALTATLPGEDGAAPSPRSGPQLLPAAAEHPDRERRARLTALLGSLGLLVVAVAGAIAMSTRRRHAEAASGVRGGRRRRQ